jgi:hypothetical protein
MLAVDFSILNQKATPAIYADTLALRPAASFAGRLFVATDSPYGVFRDTGAAWVQVASVGGGGSTGVNGLNGTTNIGLGGTLANDTTILGGGGNDLTLGLLGNDRIGMFSIYSINWDWKNRNTDGISSIYADSNVLELKFDDVTTGLPGNTSINFARTTIRSYFNGASYGLSLDDSTGKFSLGDYNNDRKYNSFVVDDDNDRFYITTSYNQIDNAQDLFYVSNKPGVNERFVKLGDFNSYNNDTYLIIDDFANTLITSGINGIAGLNFDFSTETYELGANNAKVICDNSSGQIDITSSTILLSTTPTIQTATITNTATAGIPSDYLSIQLNGNNYKILLFNP